MKSTLACSFGNHLTKHFYADKFVLCGCLAAVLFYLLVNVFAHFKYVPLSTLFMDDLPLFKQFSSTSLFEYLLTGHDQKFRPITDFFLYLGYGIIGKNTEYAYLYMLFWGSVSCIVVYFLSISVTDNVALGIAASALFSVSRFAYYAIGQYFGVMESISLINGVLVFYFAYKYLISNIEQADRYFNLMLLFEILTIFSHERYLMLMFFLYAAVFLKYRLSKKSLLQSLYISISFAAIMLFRFFYLGNRAMQGTGGSTLTLNISQVISFFKNGMTMIVGLPAGEAYLSGVYVEEVHGLYLLIPWISVVLLAIGILIYYVQRREQRLECVKITSLFISFIICSLLAGCITVRLELRWLYLPYTCYLLFIIYLLSKIKLHVKIQYVFICYLLFSSFFIEGFYRSKWVSNYLGSSYHTVNQIYDYSIGKYGSSIAERPLVIVENIDNGTIVVVPNWVKLILEFYSVKNAGAYFYNHFKDIPDDIRARNPIVLYAEQTAGDIWRKTFFDMSNIYKKVKD